jgi:hypothetical protein
LTKPLGIEKLRAAIEFNMPIPSFMTSGLEKISATCNLCTMENGSNCVV